MWGEARGRRYRRHMLYGNLSPLRHRAVPLPNKPGDRNRAAGTLDDFFDVHGPRMLAKPTLVGKRKVGRTDTSRRESRNISGMAKTPRKSSLAKNRGAFGQRLRDMRTARGLTQSELAAVIGISRSHIAAMETGADPPGREILHALATFFSVSMDFLQAGITQAPQEGRFVQDAEQLAWLNLWDAIHPSERARVIRLVRAAVFD